MAATVDYLFAFAATAHCVEDHHFDAVYAAYIEDDAVRSFFEENNPAALREMSERLLEAQQRELWRPRSNDSYRRLRALGRRPNDVIASAQAVNRAERSMAASGSAEGARTPGALSSCRSP